MPTDKHYFIERHGNDGYRVIAANASRASATARTEKVAIRLAKKFNPTDHPDVSRVRTTNTGKSDQWRSAKS